MLKNLILWPSEYGLRGSGVLTFHPTTKIEINGFSEKEYTIIRNFISEMDVVYPEQVSQIRIFNYQTSVEFFIAAIPILKEMGYEIIDYRRQETE